MNEEKSRFSVFLQTVTWIGWCTGAMCLGSDSETSTICWPVPWSTVLESWVKGACLETMAWIPEHELLSKFSAPPKTDKKEGKIPEDWTSVIQKCKKEFSKPCILWELCWGFTSKVSEVAPLGERLDTNAHTCKYSESKQGLPPLGSSNPPLSRLSHPSEWACEASFRLKFPWMFM